MPMVRLMPLLFLAMASFFLVVGLRSLLTGKPFVMAARWNLFIVVLGMLPAILQPLWISTAPALAQRTDMVLMTWLPPVLFFCLFLFLLKTLRGYIAYGVTDASMREGLLSALTRQGIASEETLGALKLPDLGADLKVAVQSWMGSGQIRIMPPAQEPLLKQIAADMNTYFRDTPVATNQTTALFYTTMGILMALFAGVFAWTTWPR
jgi:hypothetical protein